MSLFQKSVLKKHLQSLDKAIVEAAWQRYAGHFLEVAKEENIRNRTTSRFWTKLNKQQQKTHKRKMSIQEDMEWEPLFEEQQAKAAALQADILRTDREIDGVVYGLYGLGAEEVGIVESG